LVNTIKYTTVYTHTIILKITAFWDLVSCSLVEYTDISEAVHISEM
jgi:hypothetical protein